eukprot:350436-Chlamydomonas_euryale.AAC.3
MLEWRRALGQQLMPRGPGGLPASQGSFSARLVRSCAAVGATNGKRAGALRAPVLHRAAVGTSVRLYTVRASSVATAAAAAAV